MKKLIVLGSQVSVVYILYMMSACHNWKLTFLEHACIEKIASWGYFRMAALYYI